jgi:cell division protein FtsZ
MGVGSATGKDKAEEAARRAICSPLLESSISGARGILINISVSPDVSLEEVNQASSMIAEEASPDASIIWGVAFDPELDDEMKITIIATGFADFKGETSVTAPVKAEPKKVETKVAPKVVAKPPVIKKPVAPAPAPAPVANEEVVEDLDDDDIMSLFGGGATKSRS